tara:strand:- start:142 stop:1197 length:1056 start_codon:yes stop_codon:yes gene_type:complete
MYFFAMHWGHYHKNIEKIDLIDFHLAGPGTVIFKNPEENYHIPLCSRNFASATFANKNSIKVYDIINISRPLRLKNIDEFFIVIKKMISKNFFPKVLIICPLSVDFYQNNHNYMEIYSDYMAMFSSKERESITLMLLSPEGSPFTLSEEAISDFMNLSKVFTLFSDKEGESRVVSEALLCGLPVVVKKNLIGGAKDYLNDTNSKLFTSLDEAADIFIDLISNYSKYQFDTKSLEQELSEKYTKKTLINELELFFTTKKEIFKGELFLKNLSKKLPSHENELSKNIAHGETDDIITFKGFYRFLLKFTDSSSRNQLHAKVYIFDFIYKIKLIFRTYIKKILILTGFYSLIRK